MEDKRISFETAKLAKEKGFKPETEWNPKYVTGYLEDQENHKLTEFKEENWDIQGYYLAPTLTIIHKWLMNNYKIRVYPTHGASGEFNYEIRKWNYDNQIGRWERFGHISSVTTYDEALELGLIHGLNLI